MDIDKLFKAPKLPLGAGKRKMSENPTPEMLKRMKMDATLTQVPSTFPANGKLHPVTVEEEQDEGNFANRDFAPGGDADYFVEEDEEGRFFGGGLTTEQKEILNIFEGAGGYDAQEDPETLSLSGIRRLLLRFERAVNKNQDQRSKYPDDPSKFIDSEADLDAAIKSLLPLAQYPVLAYPELVKSGSATHLIGLLAHENVDIVIDVVEVVHELTDEDVGNEGDANDEEENTEALKILIQALLDNSVFELLVDNLGRLNEKDESDKQGIFHVLGVFDNILGFDPGLATQLVSKSSIMEWLLKRIQSKSHDVNRSYAAELLSILLQDNQANRLVFGNHDGTEVLLTVASNYRRRDPVDADETEFMENVFDTLCSALNEPANKTLFLKSEGVELMILMMKEKLQSRARAIKTLDYVMSGTSGTAVCESFVEALGLKTLFSAFMGKSQQGAKKRKSTAPSEDIPHLLGMMSSLFSNLASDSSARIRLLAKFVEANYEKVDKLLEIRENASVRLRVVDQEIGTEKQSLAAEELEEVAIGEDIWYLRRLDGGLFTLQIVDYILAWITMEDDGVKAHLVQMLNRNNKRLADVVTTLRVYHDNISGEESGAEFLEDGSIKKREHAMSKREILQALISYLEGC